METGLVVVPRQTVFLSFLLLQFIFFANGPTLLVRKRGTCMDDKTEFLPVAVLREPKNKLRIVDKESVAYLELRDSIRDHGILQPLLVRPVEGGYEIIEGLYRIRVPRRVGLEKVPCIIREATDDEVLVLQLQANAISPERNWRNTLSS